jgi:hypothetical protein
MGVENVNFGDNMKRLLFLIMVAVAMFSCGNDSSSTDNGGTIDFSTVVNPTFRCTATINGVACSFSKQVEVAYSVGSPLRSTGSDSLMESDSVAYSYRLLYLDVDSRTNRQLGIFFMKKFCVRDLVNKEKTASGYAFGQLLPEQFMTLFKAGPVGYAYYGADYVARDGIFVQYMDGTTEPWMSTVSMIDTLANGNAGSHFTVSNVSVLSEGKLVLEGTFDLHLYRWIQKDTVSLTNGHYKGYLEL